MKSILYVGATLMIGASIYGFVDYKNTSRQQEFTSMYDEKKVPAPAVEEEVAQPDLDLVAKKQAVSKEESAITPAETKEIKGTVAETKRSKPAVKKAKKKKKLDHRIFSRAPLREDSEEELIKPVPPKAEEKKIVQKESFGENKEQ